MGKGGVLISMCGMIERKQFGNSTVRLVRGTDKPTVVYKSPVFLSFGN